MRVPDWIYLLLKLKARLADRGWQDLTNLTWLRRTGVSGISSYLRLPHCRVGFSCVLDLIQQSPVNKPFPERIFEINVSGGFAFATFNGFCYNNILSCFLLFDSFFCISCFADNYMENARLCPVNAKLICHFCQYSVFICRQ